MNRNPGFFFYFMVYAPLAFVGFAFLGLFPFTSSTFTENECYRTDDNKMPHQFRLKSYVSDKHNLKGSCFYELEAPDGSDERSLACHFTSRLVISQCFDMFVETQVSRQTSQRYLLNQYCVVGRFWKRDFNFCPPDDKSPKKISENSCRDQALSVLDTVDEKMRNFHRSLYRNFDNREVIDPNNPLNEITFTKLKSFVSEAETPSTTTIDGESVPFTFYDPLIQIPQDYGAPRRYGGPDYNLISNLLNTFGGYIYICYQDQFSTIKTVDMLSSPNLTDEKEEYATEIAKAKNWNPIRYLNIDKAARSLIARKSILARVSSTNFEVSVYYSSQQMVDLFQDIVNSATLDYGKSIPAESVKFLPASELTFDSKKCSRSSVMDFTVCVDESKSPLPYTADIKCDISNNNNNNNNGFDLPSIFKTFGDSLETSRLEYLENDVYGQAGKELISPPLADHKFVRNTDQAVVMAGLSANKWAKALYDSNLLKFSPPVSSPSFEPPNKERTNVISYEWLHGIRYQFGGALKLPDEDCGIWKRDKGNSGDRCPQTAYNLFFGSYYANSQMIVAENVGDWLAYQGQFDGSNVKFQLHATRGEAFCTDSKNPSPFWNVQAITQYLFVPAPASHDSATRLRALNFDVLQSHPPHLVEDLFNQALLYFYDFSSNTPTNNNINTNNNDPDGDITIQAYRPYHLKSIVSAQSAPFNPSSLIPSLSLSSFKSFEIEGVTVAMFEKAIPSFGNMSAISFSGTVDFSTISFFQYGPLSRLGISGRLFIDLQMWPAFSPYNYKITASFSQEITLLPNLIDITDIFLSVRLYENAALSPSQYFALTTVCGTFSLSFFASSPNFQVCVYHSEGVNGIRIEATASRWILNFGGARIVINEIFLSIDTTTNKIYLTASWNVTSSWQFDVFGVVSSDFTGFGVDLYDLSMDDINAISYSLFGNSIQTDLTLSFDHIFFGLASTNGHLGSTAVIAGINLFATFSFGEIQNATVSGTLGPDGLTLFATLSELPASLTGLPFTLHDPTLFIMVSTDDTKPSELFIGVNITVPSPSGSLSVEALIYFQSNPSATIVAGDVKNIALSSFLPFAAGTPFDLHFADLVVASASGNIDAKNIQPLIAKFPALQAAMPQGGTGLSIIAKIDEVPLLSNVMDLSSANLFLSYRMGTDSTSFSIIVDLTGAGGSTSSSHFNAVDLSIGVILSPTSYKLVVKFSMLVNLPGNGYPSTFSAVLTADPLVINLAASLTSTTAGAPAWKNAFGITNLNLINVGLDAGFSPESGLPDELGFSASMQIATSDGVVHELDVAVLAGADSQFVLKFEEYNIDLPFLVAFVETLIGYEIPGVETLASLTSMFTISHLLVYFSDGASIAGINYPAGGKLNMSASLFGKYDVANLVGEVLPSQGGGKFNGSLPHIELGPLIVSSFTDPSQGPSFGFEITKSSQQFWVNGAIQISSFFLGILLLISPSQLQFTFDLRVIPGLSVRITATAHGDIKDPLTASFSISGSFDISALLNLFQDALTESLAFFSDIGNGVDQLYQSSVQQFESATAALESGWSDAQAEVSQASLKAINVLANGGEIKQAAEAAYVAATDFASRAGEEGQLLIANANEIAGEVQDLAQKSLDQVQKFWGDQLSAAKGVVTDILSQLDRLGIHLLGVNRDGPRLRNKLMRLVSAHSSGHGPISAFNDSMKEASVNHESHGSFHPQFSLNPLDDINELIDDLRQAYDAAVRVVDLVVHELDVAVSAATSRLNDVVALGRQLVKEANDASHALSSLASDWENQASKAIQNIATLTSQLENQAANIVIEAEANVNIALGALKEGATATFNAVELAANKMTHVFKKVAALEDNFVHHPEDLISFQSASFHGNLGDLKTGSIGFTLVGVLCEQPFEQTFNLNLEETGSDLKDSILQYFLTSPCSPVSLFE